VAVLANQYLAQLPESVRTVVLGTVRTQVVLQVEYDDARLLERRFAPRLSADDLMGLSRYEIAMRPSLDDQAIVPVTGMTLRLSDPVRDAGGLARVSREHNGMARAGVEAALTAGWRPPANRGGWAAATGSGRHEGPGVAIGVVVASSTSTRSGLARGAHLGQICRGISPLSFDKARSGGTWGQRGSTPCRSP
jgi:hypothetical protein